MPNSVSQDPEINGQEQNARLSRRDALKGGTAAAIAAASYGPIDPEKIMRTAEVLYRTGWSRSTLWRRIRQGDYPAPMEIGPNLNGWLGKWHLAWLESLPRRAYEAD